MLRAHAEQRWLSREVVPVVRQLQHPEELPEGQLDAALAYLEVTWLEARRLAAETDAAFADLNAASPRSEEGMPTKARKYHATVHTLREAVARNVTPLIPISCRRSKRTVTAREHAGS
jgi:hypothetical protein